MRVHLSGEGGPIPKEALPDPGGNDVPSLAFFMPNGYAFHPVDYAEQGYTNFEVWCVGGCGGHGGILDEFYPTTDQSYGGAGGGGGLHRVMGLLSDLPDPSPVVVGAAGVDGAASNLAGGDGGASSFNGAICQASGGKGGSPTSSGNHPGGDGGQGGMGGRVLVGGGADGGKTQGALHVEAKDGTWNGAIGQGGGGGRGGTFLITDPRFGYSESHESGSGGQGSFSFVDPSVYGARQNRSAHDWRNYLIVPGGGGGAMINKLMGYGSKAPSFNPDGAVYIRLFKIV